MHVCTLLGCFCSRRDCSERTLAALWTRLIDGWTLRDSSGIFRVLVANVDDDDFEMAASSSIGIGVSVTAVAFSLHQMPVSSAQCTHLVCPRGL